MNAAYFQTVYRYNFWANRQIRACMDALTEAQFVQPQNYSVGSVRDQCIHMLNVEYWWFYFLGQGVRQNVTTEEAIETLTQADIHTLWEQAEAVVMAYIDTLTEDELQRAVKPPHWGEDDRPVRVWEALLQVANHSTDHRAQLLRLFYDFGVPTFGQDYLGYTDETLLPG